MTLACALVYLAMLTNSGLSLAADGVKGDYIEARTCSVYIGACHFSGEATTAGREAIMLWRVREGRWNGIEMKSFTVAAVIACDRNVADKDAVPKVALYVDSNADMDQRRALVELARKALRLPAVSDQSVHARSISVEKGDSRTTVRIENALSMDVVPYPCAHCVQPHETWYPPITAINNAVVASAALNAFDDRSAIGITWRRSNENSVYLGEFELSP